MTSSAPKSSDHQALDALTGGAFSAATSGERAARLREWLATEPTPESMQEVYRELSGRDKGAARVLRERLDEIRRSRGQEAIAAEWAEKAQALLAQGKLNIADALAWQRDAAKAGAPLSREPLAALKSQLAERIRGIEDLQHRVQVQREAAVLLAQRIEVLSTKPWRDAHAAAETLRTDVPEWQAQAGQLEQDPLWVSVDVRFPPQLEASRGQLQAVWEAFQSALALATAAEADPAAPLPPVPVWADEFRAARGLPLEAAPKPAKPKVDPQLRARAQEAVMAALQRLEQEVAEGHGKASTGAAAALRAALKDHGRLIDDKLEHQAQSALAAAGELEGWQRWRTDQLRQELVAKAEDLFEKPAQAAKPAQSRKGAAAASAPAAGADTESAPSSAASPEAVAADAAPETAVNEAVATETAATEAAATETVAPEAITETANAAPLEAAPAPVAAPSKAAPADTPLSERKPRFGGRKMQEQLRSLRDQWKKLDQVGAPNHALWKRFDEACNAAHKVVEVWLEKVKAEAAEHRARRTGLIEEVRAWSAAHPDAQGGDWKAFARAIHQFENRWREAGHLSEKAFAEMQPQWKAVMTAAQAPLAAAQKASLERRQALIAEAQALGAQPQLRIDSVKALQQRWQAEAQSVPIDRRHEHKLWDAFRKPIDEAFQRKGQERDRAAAALSEHDRIVLDASRALEAANASGDAQKIRQAMSALEAALKGQAQARQAEADAAAGARQAAEAQGATDAAAPEGQGGEAAAAPDAAGEAAGGDEAPAAPAPAPKPAPRPVVAMRGDDRPGMKKTEPAAAARGRPGQRDAGRPGARPGERDGRMGRDGRDARGGREGREGFEARGPRLGDAAFRAQREALEHAQSALRKLAAQAHGESLTQLLGAWEHRSAEEVPTVSELGKAVTPAVRGSWLQALSAAPAGDASQTLLRLEIAADVQTPAEHLSARRMLQLQMLTRRNDPSPAQTWGQDVALVLTTPYQAQQARRLQNVLKALLRG